MSSTLTEKKLNLTFLFIGLTYSLLTLLISSVVITVIQKQGSALSGKISELDKDIEVSALHIREPQQEISNGVLLLSMGILVGSADMPKEKDRYEMFANSLRSTGASAIDYFNRGIDGMHTITRLNASDSTDPIQVRIDALKKSFNIEEAKAIAAELLATYKSQVDGWADERTRLKAEKEDVDHLESMVKNAALALQFLGIGLFFIRDYYKEKLKDQPRTA